MLLLSINVSANTKTKEFKIDTPKGFTEVYHLENLSKAAKILGMSDGELSEFLKKNEITYFAVSNDKSTQIRLSGVEDNFGNTVGEMNNLNNKQLKDLIKTLKKESTAKFSIDTSNGRNYIKSSSLLKDSGGEYTVTQYLTVVNGKTYYLTCYNSGTKTSSEIKSVFSNLIIYDVLDKTNNLKYIIGLLIVALMLICVGLIVGIYKKLKVK